MFRLFKKRLSLTAILLISIFLYGLFLRYENIKGGNIVLDYDQYEDLYYTYKLAIDRKLPIIGRAIYGDPKIHHGVFYYYYNFIPFAISGGNPYASAYWNSLFNGLTVFILFYLSKKMFKKNFPAISSAVIAAVSFEFIKFSNWLTIDNVAIFIVPLFYLGLWVYQSGKKWGLTLAALFLGLSIQTDLSLLYLIGVFMLYWLIFKPALPSFNILVLSVLTFLAATLTLILTEIKLNFAGVKTLLDFSSTFSDTKLPFQERVTFFWRDVGINFSNNLFPGNQQIGSLTAACILLLTLYLLFKTKSKQEKSAIYFLLLYIFSPAITLVLGYHQQPWFLIGLPPAIALISGYVLSKLKFKFLIMAALLTIIWINSNIILARPQKAYELFNSVYDRTSYMAYQLEVIDYTYKSSGGEPFSFNAVTYPLYYNGMWAYLYNWYGRGAYGYAPGWLGGNQLYPYDLLKEATKKERYFYILISETGRIPEIYKNLGKSWGEKKGKLIEEKEFSGFTVQKYEKPQTI